MKKTHFIAVFAGLAFSISNSTLSKETPSNTSNGKAPFKVEDLVTLDRISSATLSPSGKEVAYVLRKTDLDANKGRTDIWLSRVKSGEAIQLTTDKSSDFAPKWYAETNWIYFLSTRSGSTQVWRVNTKNRKVEQITDFPIDVTSFKLSRDGKKLVFSSSVYPECENFQCTVEIDKKEKLKKSSGVVYDKMFVRHWDHWVDKKQSQLFLVRLDNKGHSIAKSLVSITSSVNANIPSDPFGGDEEYTLSKSGDAVYFSARLQDAVEPTSTNFDIYRVNFSNTKSPQNLTKQNKAWDTSPVISHDGQTLAYLAMKRPGFEADKFDVVLRDLRSGKSKRITETWDRSFGSLQFSTDDKFLFLTGNHLGTKALWKYEIATGQKTLFNKNGAVVGVTVGQDKVVFAKDTLTSPVQLFSSDLNGKNQKQITFANKDKLEKIAFGEYEQFSFKGWNDETVYGYIVKPVNFDPKKKYPLAYLIHGGPQGSFGDHFHYRWNPQTYAGQGFVSVMIDFHGSTGYGQAFTDSISQNWGSKPFEDLQKGLAYAQNKYSFIDKERSCALGASYGGYMINWIAGNWPEQFKCLVNHDGVFDNRMMYYATEELWFVEWENGGTYFDVPQNHEKYNPANYVRNWKTPMLVIQGELDYRIPVTQALATFTALQRKGIKSKLLYFPDENHWVLKPANSIQWHNEVNKWLKEFLF
ncbi:S9 family peptidase [Aliikangiella sp. G2MR2-5]|uniref:S9 family peptidase n=1 Tax=Aliikangiella sp. G2MR2-5 TaxID=2788943 RepID=UPI0018A9CD24|nr:S9 family peptidase [Aliikangiella sp. G2MR2-5]